LKSKKLNLIKVIMIRKKEEDLIEKEHIYLGEMDEIKL